jgi:hypothetical protein
MKKKSLAWPYYKSGRITGFDRTWENNKNWILKKTGREGVDSAGLDYDQVAGFCQHGNELSCSIKQGSFLII